ncbi:MAG TPA: tetratricopeptide repeat protein [Gemmatimonadaceae bacterium]|nr:tetratricopeptide repeat protein [Gemmatimonadaceae bacterium]
MSNALKLKKKAAEFEQKKQFDKALQIYIQILDESDGEDDEADVALYNRVGDLLMRQGSVGDAVNYYEKAVDLYAESGFFNNAIALCNKILRQSPGRNSIYYKLGKISAKKGFISDAKQNFLEYADRMQKGGQLDEAFRALKEFADLCPDQDDIRLMLAEQLSKKDRKGEAIEQLQHLYEKFVAEGRGAEARATVDRMKAIDPEVEPKEGGGISRQKSSDLVFIDLSDSRASEPPPPPPKAARPEQSRKTVKLPQPQPEPEPDVLDDLPSLDVEPEVEDDLLPLPPLDEGEAAPEPELEPLEAFEPLDLAEGAESLETAEGLETMEEFSAPAERASGQIAGFEQTVLDPDIDAAFPAETLPELEPLTGSEFAELDLPESSADHPAPRLTSHDLSLPGQLPSLDPPGRSPLSLTGEMDLIIPESDLPLPKVRKPATNGAPPKPPPLQVDFTPEVDTSDLDGRSATDSDLALTTGADSLASEPAEADDVDLPAWMSPDAEVPPADEAPTDLPLLDVSPEPAPAVHHHSHTPLAREVDTLRERAAAEPTNWVIRQRLAEALLEDGDRDEGLQELEVVMLGLERSHDLDGARSVADEIIRLNPNSVRHHQKRVEYAFRAADKPRLAEAYLELADSLFRAGHADKARAVYQRVLELAPDDPRAQAALSTFEPPPRPQPTPSAVRAVRPQPTQTASDDFVNLSDWLSEDQAPKSTRMVVDEEAPSGDEEADFADMLRKFKQGVADNVDEEDHESHYDLGVAYKEMGLVDEAISEFQKALRGTDGRVRTYEALGQCFLEKQQFQVAATILGRALNEPGIGDDQLVGVLYLLGYCSEALRANADALRFYQRVFAVDIQFRDVADRLTRLEKVTR